MRNIIGIFCWEKETRSKKSSGVLDLTLRRSCKCAGHEMARMLCIPRTQRIPYIFSLVSPRVHLKIIVQNSRYVAMDEKRLFNAHGLTICKTQTVYLRQLFARRNL